jgi:hypothetical protein
MLTWGGGVSRRTPMRDRGSHEINAAFATFVRERPDALFVGLTRNRCSIT